MPPLRIKANKSAGETRHRLPTRADRAKLDKARIFQWTSHSSGLVDNGQLITLPPRILDTDNVTETNREDGHLDRIRKAFQRWFGKRIKPIGAEGEKENHEPSADDLVDPMGSDEISGGKRVLRRHRLRLSPEGLSIGGVSLRWIDIGEISARDNVIEIFVVPFRQDPHGCTVMRSMKTTYSLEVPAGRRLEIESAIRQFMARWKVPLKGPLRVLK
jgi:hypothetical protein